MAEDAIHTAFTRLCQLEQTQIDDLTSYVFASVRNAALDGLRSQQRSNALQQSVFEQTIRKPAVSVSPVANLLTNERDERLRKAVDALAADEREVVVMKIYSGLTFETIGRVLNQPAKTAATRYRRALIKLQDKLRDLI